VCPVQIMADQTYPAQTHRHVNFPKSHFETYCLKGRKPFLGAKDLSWLGKYEFKIVCTTAEELGAFLRVWQAYEIHLARSS
jgi:hypothetical protein